MNLPDPQADIPSLLASARSHVNHLTKILPAAVDRDALSTKSMSPNVALCFRAAQAWRTEEFARAACDMFERGDVVVAVSNTRGAVESVAATWYLKSLIETELARESISPDLQARLKRLLLGQRGDTELPEAVNVLTMLDKADAEIPGIRLKYDRMSEFGHPNYHGAAGVYALPNPDTFITRFGRGIRQNEYPSRLGLNCLIAAMGTLFHAFNKIGDMTPAFVEACERAERGAA